jgi:HSP20 family protein
MALMRYDPFREMDRFTEQLFGSGSGSGTGSRAPFMPMDAVRSGDRVEIYFDVPGVAPEAIDVSVERNVLTVKAERSWWPGEDDEVLARERSQGTYTRQVMLGEALDPERLEAHYEHGVLRVAIPVAEKAQPRRVEVRTGSQEAIEVS